jgi:signal transduction histidine kinase
MLLELCENSLEAMQALPERFIVFHVDVVSVAREAKDLDLAPGSYARVSIVDHGDRGDTAEVDTAVKSLSTAQAKEFDRGLGLSMLMVRSVMKQHGGTIAVASRRQTGTNISLYFPLP